jgi:hypothetical protein
MTQHKVTTLSPHWEYVSDRVMGGVSSGGLATEIVAGRRAAHLTGRVSLENNGGFVQIAFDLGTAGQGLDPAGWTGLMLKTHGNGAGYEVRLRTDQLTRPWQSYRFGFEAPVRWQQLFLPFSGFEPHRTDKAFEPARLCRIGVLAVGRAFDADIAIASVGYY